MIVRNAEGVINGEAHGDISSGKGRRRSRERSVVKACKAGANNVI